MAQPRLAQSRLTPEQFTRLRTDANAFFLASRHMSDELDRTQRAPLSTAWLSLTTACMVNAGLTL